jgi:hypothetical protein
MEDAQEGVETSAFPRAACPDSLEEPSEGRTDLAAALAEHRRRDIQAGRTLIGPHRADLQGVYAAKGCQPRPMLDRRAEGAADQPDPGLRPARWRRTWAARQ